MLTETKFRILTLETKSISETVVYFNQQVDRILLKPFKFLALLLSPR
jgi:hypothetical protein